MNSDRDFERLFRQEFKEITPNLIWKDSNGVYQVFDKYQIIPEHSKYRVFCSATEVGVFNSTKTALSWCIADKYNAYNTARDILVLDNKLGALTNDIIARIAVGERGNKWEFKEIVGTKLETKIIRKKQIENELAKCVNWAKYIQYKGFNNETVRTSRNQSNKASR